MIGSAGNGRQLALTTQDAPSESEPHELPLDSYMENWVRRTHALRLSLRHTALSGEQ